MYDKLVKGEAARRGQLVVAAPRTLRRFGPSCPDLALAPEPREDEVDRGMARDNSFRCGEGPGELEAIVLVIAQEGQDAVLDGSVPELGKRVGSQAKGLWRSEDSISKSSFGVPPRLRGTQSRRARRKATPTTSHAIVG